MIHDSLGLPVRTRPAGYPSVGLCQPVVHERHVPNSYSEVDELTDLLEAVNGLADLIEVDPVNHLAELLERNSNKAGSYYYEDVTVKRWILGSGGMSGNCEDCIENSAAGDIEESEFFPAYGSDGPVDEPPLHPHCDCTVEYRDTRRRVYT